MSKDKLTDYDATASNNTDVGGISVAEGMLPSGVNNAIREQMSHLKDFASGTEAITKLSTASIDSNGGTIKLDGNYPTGTGNVALGNAALDDGSLSGGNNTAVGASALSGNTTGERNTTLGFSAGSSITTSNYCVFVGSYCGDSATGGSNVAIGDTSMRAATGTGNVAVGSDSLNQITSGSYNTVIGFSAGTTITTGFKNTIIGRYNGNQNGLDLRTSNNNIVLSDGDGIPQLHINSSNDITATTFFTGQTPYSGDLNSLFKTGFYRSENTNSNNPSATYYSVIVYGNQGNVTSQIATALNSTITYVRSYNTSWTAWARLDT